MQYTGIINALIYNIHLYITYIYLQLIFLLFVYMFPFQVKVASFPVLASYRRSSIRNDFDLKRKLSCIYVSIDEEAQSVVALVSVHVCT